MNGAVVLTADAAIATLYPEFGGRLGQLEVAGTTYLRGPENGAAELGWGYWGSYPLLPWSNRIPEGRFPFAGETLEVPVSWQDGSALHGLAARTPWTVVVASDQTAELRIDIDEGPYVVEGRQRFRLTATHLEQDLQVVNRGERRVPVGLGIHPWFRVSPVRVSADLIWPGEPMPSGAPIPVPAALDLRVARVAPTMDRCYTGLTDSSVDVAGLRVAWDGPITQVVVFSGDPDWVCVEPVTMANDGFRLADEGVPDTGVLALAPGESASVTYRFTW